LKTVSRVGIVGLGTIGVQEFALWQRAGLQPIGYDISERRVRSLDAPHVSTQIRDLEPADVLVLCLPNIAPSGENSLAAFDQFVDAMQSLSSRQRLIIVASTVPIGFTRDLATRLGPHGTLVSHAPERFDPGRGTELGEILRVVGAVSPEALEQTVSLYSKANVPTYRAEPVEVAEASKLLENSFRLVNISFINEFAELCRRMDIVAADVIDAAATKPFAFMAHQPGVGAGGICIPTMPRFLLEAARQSGLEMPILEDAVSANAQIVKRVAEHVRQLLAASEIRRARILVVGATYKPNYPDTRGSAALAFARGLATQHDVSVLDPIVDSAGFPEDLPLIRELPSGQRFDAVVIALKHRDTDVAALRELSPILIDLVRGATEATESISSSTR
jgi:UDP-N-acetyl-D-glucosamine dehydrogenase